MLPASLREWVLRFAPEVYEGWLTADTVVPTQDGDVPQ